ncbi:MAG: ABC transporter ATP-binding protein [Actinomycetota bacterium]
MGEPAVQIADVSKAFKIVKEAPTSLKARIMHTRRRADDFWALRDVTYDIRPGTTVGLIGPNGSGKTTLLKIISGILRPTRGTVTTRGRIAALLELGAGFHQELTGRENVYLNASILGLTRKETDKVFDEIVAFAGLEEFIDTKVKFYSSGMFVRLGFSVAVHVDPDVLLIDEVLAVGDEGFQKKCLDRITHFQQEGRTIVFVTHVVDQVLAICTEAMMLVEGRMHVAGSAQEAVDEYRRVLLGDEVAVIESHPTGEVEIMSVQTFATDGRSPLAMAPGDDLTIQVDVRTADSIDDPVVVIRIHDQHEILEYSENTANLGVNLGRFEGKRRFRFTLHALPYTSGEYTLTALVRSRDEQTVYGIKEHQEGFAIPAATDRPAVAYIRTDVDVEDL